MLDESRMLVGLGEIAVRSVLLVGAGALAVLVLRRASAACRCLIWQLVVVLLLCLPLALVMVPKLALPVLPATARPAATVTLPWIQSLPGRSQPAASEVAAPIAEKPGPSAAARRPPRAGLGLILLWGMGTALGLGSLAVALLRARRLLDGAREVEHALLLAQLKEAQRALSYPGPVRLVSGVGGPMTCGLLRPVIFLPEEAETWSDERCRAVLLHEVAHVQRRDWCWSLGAQVACAVYWWNPLVRVAAEQLRREMERACDDQVLAAGVPASEYAAHLIALAAGARASALEVGMVRGSHLTGRIEAILRERSARGVLSRRGAVTAAATALLALLPLTSIALTGRPFRPAPIVLHPAAAPPGPVRTRPVSLRQAAPQLADEVLPVPEADAALLTEARPLPPAAAPAAPLSGRIVVGGYVQGEGWRIFSLDPATGKLEVAIRHGGERARLAPDGRSLAYERDSDGEAPALLVGDLTGEAATTAHTYAEPWMPPDSRYPVWAPNGKYFVCSFAEGQREPGFKTYAFPADGSRKVGIPIPATDWVSDWSPDAQRLLTVSGSHVYLMRIDGTEARALTEGAGWSNWAPRFSPDGKRVLYAASQRPGDPAEPVHDALWTVGVDGKERRKLFSEPNVGALGAWSPDGRHLVVIRWDWERTGSGKGIAGRTYRAEIMDAEGNGRRVLASFPWMARVGMPDWR